MATNESQLVKAMERAIVREWPTAWVLKVHGGPYQTGGVPDLLVVVDGHPFGFEAKFLRPGETREHALSRVTLRQQHTLDRLAGAGVTSAAVISVDEVLDTIRRCVTL